MVIQRNGSPSPERDPTPHVPPREDPPVDPDKQKRDPLPPSNPDVYPEEPANPNSPSVPEF